MSPLWILPVLVIAFGVAGVALATRRLAAEAQAAAGAVDDLRILADEAAGLRSDADGLRTRGDQ